MSSNNHEGNENNLSLDKVENYVQDNKKSLTIIVGAAVLIHITTLSWDLKKKKHKTQCLQQSAILVKIA
jgi:hypothetical protein